jgi:hypothetical protein
MVYDWYRKIGEEEDILQMIKPPGRPPDQSYRARVSSLLDSCKSMSLNAMSLELGIDRHTIRDIIGNDLKLRKTYYNSHDTNPHFIVQKILKIELFTGEFFQNFRSPLHRENKQKHKTPRLDKVDMGRLRSSQGIDFAT